MTLCCVGFCFLSARATTVSWPLCHSCSMGNSDWHPTLLQGNWQCMSCISFYSFQIVRGEFFVVYQHETHQQMTAPPKIQQVLWYLGTSNRIWKRLFWLPSLGTPSFHLGMWCVFPHSSLWPTTASPIIMSTLVPGECVEWWLGNVELQRLVRS